MNEGTSQSTSSGQPAKPDETISQIGTQYDSDSELLANDKLQLDDSDENTSVAGEQRNDGTALPPSSSKCSQSEAQDRNSDPVINDNESDGEHDDQPSRQKRKKITQLIDSESEEEERSVGNGQSAVPVQKKISAIVDSDSEIDISADERLRKQNLEIDAIGDKIEQSMNNLKSLVDSDSPTPDEEFDSELKRKKKKLKTKKERTNAKKNADSSNLLASLNLDLSDEETQRTGSNEDGTDDGENSASGNDEPKRKRKANKKALEEKPQRMSAKAAMEQMKVIQSESQRMAREANVTVPYHRPKQRTLQEFLNRRTVFKCGVSAAGGIAEGRKKVAAAIKMTPEELVEYARKLDEREKEAKVFFKSESDEDEKDETETVQPQDEAMTSVDTCVEPQNDIISEVEPEKSTELDTNQNGSEKEVERPTLPDTNMEFTESLRVSDTEPLNEIAPNVEPEKSMEVDSNLNESGGQKLMDTNTEFIQSLRVSDTEEDHIDAMVSKTHDNIEQIRALQHDDIGKPSSSASVPIDYDLFSKPSTSKLAQMKAELLLDETIPIVPKLKGNPDSLIELDCEQPKLSGADILLKRFAKCAGKKANRSTNVSILSADEGVLQISTISFAVDEDDRDPNGKDPVPGAAFVKLKQTLRQKMEQTRRESLRQRQEEIEQGKKLDEEEDEEEEILENDDELEDEMDEDEEQTEEKGDGKGLINEEAEEMDSEVDEAEHETEVDVNSSDSSSDEDTANEPPVDGVKRKSRIIAAVDDSDEEIKEKTDDMEVADTVQLLSTLGSQKLTQTDRDNQESGGSMNLLWKDSTEPVSATQVDDDLLALCSGRFGSTQVSSAIEQDADRHTAVSQQSDLPLFTQNEETTSHNALFTQHGEQPVDEDELQALCSGKFVTQQKAPETEQNIDIPSDSVAKRRMIIASSDEEEQDKQEEQKSKKKRRKRRNVNISDDEESASEAERNEDDDGENDDKPDDEDQEELEEEMEHFVDYDSEENEIDVVMTKTDKQKVANTFLENEAELSESEWGSADEDEKDLDRYDIELGDEEKFDQEKLQQELERIHMRRMLEQDKKEVKTLQDMFFEDEEKDGIGRERQFRWKNVETTFSLDYDSKPGDENAKDEASDEENEMQWRKMRHEREQLLKEKQIDLDAVNLSTTLLDKTVEEDENNSSVTNTSSLVVRKKITIVRSKKCTDVSTPKDSPFLITKSTVAQGYKASFLSRDTDTLNKLASMVKVNPDTEGASTVVAAKGRNFVFATVSPAVDKMGSKRSLDADENESTRSAKKARKATEHNRTKKKLLLGQLM